jgi:SulP family sulfate permease
VALGVESVPDGLASGLLAGVNPVAGLYACLFGMVGGALVTSSTSMAVQSTGAMSIIVADVDLTTRADPAGALFALTLLTGAVMVAAGLLKLGSVLRFVSASVMTGFITAVGVNIVLGQLEDFTGYAADGSSRITRTLDLVLHLGQVDAPTVAVGATTVALIVVLERTPLGALGMVVAIVAGSALAAVLSPEHHVEVLGDLVDVPRSLPRPALPALGELLGLLIPACSLAFVGLVQGAGVTAGFPNRDGSFPDSSRDFVGQGAGNLLSGTFQGMPVGGSMSASSLAVAGGATSRRAFLVAGAVMAVVVVAFAPLVERIAMPALAGLLIVIGVGTVRPANVTSIARTGPVQLVVMVTTLVLTMVIPLQYAVLIGVAFSVILYVAQQSTRVVTKRLELFDDGRIREVDPPAAVPPGEVVVLQPHGSVFFAAAPVLEAQLPQVTPTSVRSVVILRLRGSDDLGATVIDVLRRYAAQLRAAGSKLAIVTDNPRIPRQLEVTGALDSIDPSDVHLGSEWVGATVRQAHAEAAEWVSSPAAPP